ncbi:MAG TPA: hypothetical protein VK210_08950 [Terriglobia bacterium]|nr:hypothetical protein [Terriglobia bacterium]
MTGNACNNFGATLVSCQNIATTSSIQTSLASERAQLDSDLHPFKYYPLIQLAIGYKF